MAPAVTTLAVTLPVTPTPPKTRSVPVVVLVLITLPVNTSGVLKEVKVAVVELLKFLKAVGKRRLFSIFY
jgi:hypothetical protein